MIKRLIGIIVALAVILVIVAASVRPDGYRSMLLRDDSPRRHAPVTKEELPASEASAPEVLTPKASAPDVPAPAADSLAAGVADSI